MKTDFVLNHIPARHSDILFPPLRMLKLNNSYSHLMRFPAAASLSRTQQSVCWWWWLCWWWRWWCWQSHGGSVTGCQMACWRNTRHVSRASPSCWRSDFRAGSRENNTSANHGLKSKSLTKRRRFGQQRREVSVLHRVCVLHVIVLAAVSSALSLFTSLFPVRSQQLLAASLPLVACF